MKISVTPLGRSAEPGQMLDRKSYRVAISGDGKSKAIEVRLSLSVLEENPQPEEYIKKWVENHERELKDGSVVDLP